MLVTLICGVPLEAQRLAPADTREAATSAHTIVRARVVDVQVRDEGWIQTYVTLQPLEVVKGESSGTITVRMFGGRIGNKETSGGDALPAFKAGEEVIVFLQTSGQPYAALDVRHVYRISTLASGARVVQPAPTGLGAAVQDAIAPTGLRVEDFVSALKTIR